MSRFSGKCDLYDIIYTTGNGFEDFKRDTKGTIFIGYGDRQSIRFDKEIDIAPYYAHLVSASVHIDGKFIVWISNISWPEFCGMKYGRNGEYDHYIKRLAEYIEGLKK